jgi:hypothetical protein
MIPEFEQWKPVQASELVVTKIVHRISSLGVEHRRKRKYFYSRGSQTFVHNAHLKTFHKFCTAFPE